MKPNKTVLVIGASRGLGLALAEEYAGRGWQVVATERSPSQPLATLAARYPRSIEIERVEVTDRDAVEALRTRVSGRRIDTLFVNVGIALAPQRTPSDVAEDDFTRLMLTNTLAPMRLVEIFADLVPEHGAIAVMSSELASITRNQGSWEIYAASKAALNMLMKCFAARHPRDRRALRLVAPGWVRTDMGGTDAALSIEESIPHVVSSVEAEGRAAGLLYIDRFGQSLPW